MDEVLYMSVDGMAVLPNLKHKCNSFAFWVHAKLFNKGRYHNVCICGWSDNGLGWDIAVVGPLDNDWDLEWCGVVDGEWNHMYWWAGFVLVHIGSPVVFLPFLLVGLIKELVEVVDLSTAVVSEFFLRGIPIGCEEVTQSDASEYKVVGLYALVL